MNAEEHIEAAEAWLETGENGWRRFTGDKAPRDPGEMRKAEVAIGLSRAHAALAAVQAAWPPRRLAVGDDALIDTTLAPNGQPIPVSPVPPSRRT